MKSLGILTSEGYHHGHCGCNARIENDESESAGVDIWAACLHAHVQVQLTHGGKILGWDIVTTIDVLDELPASPNHTLRNGRECYQLSYVGHGRCIKVYIHGGHRLYILVESQRRMLTSFAAEPRWHVCDLVLRGEARHLNVMLRACSGEPEEGDAT